MPRSVEPASINTGTGLAAKDSVEANALVHPTGGNDGLRAHLVDPSRAHEARAVNVVDTPDNFASDHVEGALEELATGGALSRGNGVLIGGTWTNLGLVLTLATPTTILLEGNAREFAGESVLLPGGFVTVYVYIDSGTKALTASTSLPTYGDDHVPIAQVNTTAAAGTDIDHAFDRDIRFFVKDLDKKLNYTVRANGAALLRDTEANFETIEAALWWIENYFGGASEKATITVRGVETISSTLDVPTDNITFQGDGEAIFDTGASFAPMFNLNGKLNVAFRNITFRCQHVASKAIADAGLTAEGLVVEDCKFVSGAQDWVACIELTRTVSAQKNICVRKSVLFASDTGIAIYRPALARVIDCEVTDTTGTSGTSGISIGHASQAVIALEGLSYVRGCRVIGFTDAFFNKGVACSINDCRVTDSINGIHNEGFQNDISGVFISLDTNVGVKGIDSDGTNHIIRGNTIFNGRAEGTYGGVRPFGIVLRAGSNRVRLTDNYINGFRSSSTVGTGINVETTSDHVVITGGVIDTPNTGIDIETGSDNCVITGVRLTEINGTGILTLGPSTVITGCNIDLDTGASIIGIDVDADNVRIADCTLVCARSSWSGETPHGIRVKMGGDRANIANCLIDRFYNGDDDLGRGITIESSCSDAVITGGFIIDSKVGVYIGTASSRVSVSGVNIKDVEQGIFTDGPKTNVNNCSIRLDVDRALQGITCGSGATRALVSNNEIENPRTGWGGEATLPFGIRFEGTESTASGNHIKGVNNTNTAAGEGIAIQADKCKVNGNIVEDCITGIRARAVEDFEINGNQIIGGEDTVQGISIEGAAGAAGRTRNFTCNSNLITEFTSEGIAITGHAFTGTVNGNTIDGRLDSVPTDPTAIGINVVRGSGNDTIRYVTISNNVVQRCTSGILLEGPDLTDPIQDIKVCGNTVHHCGQAESSTATADVEAFTFGSKGIGVKFGEAIEILDNKISGIGVILTDVDTEVFPSVGGLLDYVAARGIFLLNCQRVSVANNGITDLQTTVSAGAPIADKAFGIAAHWLNTGVGTHLFESLNIDHNTINGEGGTTDRGIFLKTLDGSADPPTDHILRGVNITGNVIENTVDTPIAVYVISGHTITSFKIEGNNLATVTANSTAFIDILSLTNANAIIQGISILGNIIKWGLSGDAITGIRIQGSSAGTAVIEHITIQGNTLEGAEGSGTLVTDAVGIAVTTLGAVVSAGGLNQVQITDNNLWRFDKTCIVFGSTFNVQCTNALIANNVLTDFETFGIDIVFGQEVRGLTIEGNTFQAANAVATDVKGIVMTFMTDVAATDDLAASGVAILNNTFSNISGAGLEMDFTTGSSSVYDGLANFQVVGNTFDAVGNGGAGSGHALGMESAGLCTNWKVEGNTFTGCGYDSAPNPTLFLSFVGEDLDYSNISVSGNTFSGDEHGSIQIDFFLSGQSNAGVVSDVRVCNNVMSSYGSGTPNLDGILLSMGATQEMNRFRIDGNEIVNSPNKGILIDAEGVHEGEIDLAGITDLSVSNNSISNSTEHSIEVKLAEGDDAINPTLNTGLVFRGNRVYDAGDRGIYVYASTTDAGPKFDTVNVLFSDNIVSGSANEGIVFRHESNNAGDDCIDVTFANNTVRECGDPATGNETSGQPGISIRVTNSLRNFKFIGNSTNLNNGGGFFIDLGVADEAWNNSALTFVGTVEGTATAPTFVGNISRGSDVAPGNVAFYGTNWPPTEGVNVANVDNRAANGWDDLDGASWMGAAAATAFTGSITI